jgi:hypothetical protein
VPYRDAVELTLPLSLYIGSGAILAAGPFAIRDIFATGLVYLALTLAVLTVVFTFLVAQAYFASRRVAVLVALIISASTPCPGSTRPQWSRDHRRPVRSCLALGRAEGAAIPGRPVRHAGSARLAARPAVRRRRAGLAITRYLTRWDAL